MLGGCCCLRSALRRSAAAARVRLPRAPAAVRGLAVYALGESEPDMHPSAWVADNAAVVGNVVMKEDSSVWFNATVRGDNDPITIGARTNIQDGSVLHSDEGVPLTVGDDVTVGHMVMLHGCTIESGSLIGIGSVLLNNCHVGKNCIIGANSLIPEGKVIPDNSLVMGSPGKVVREISSDLQKQLLASARHYVDNAKAFSTDLRVLPPRS